MPTDKDKRKQQRQTIYDELSSISFRIPTCDVIHCLKRSARANDASNSEINNTDVHPS